MYLRAVCEAFTDIKIKNQVKLSVSVRVREKKNHFKDKPAPSKRNLLRNVVFLVILEGSQLTQPNPITQYFQHNSITPTWLDYQSGQVLKNNGGSMLETCSSPWQKLTWLRQLLAVLQGDGKRHRDSCIVTQQRAYDRCVGSRGGGTPTVKRHASPS